MITCVVGSGGKTTLIYKLAKTYLAEGKRVLVTSTTHMYRENDTLVTDDADTIIERLEKENYVFTGTACEEENKIGSLSADTLQKLCAYADQVSAHVSDELSDLQSPVPSTEPILEILIEADGSRQLPLKFPRPDEPVLVPGCDRIIIVSSLLALGKPAVEVIHRFSDAQPLLCITERTPVTPQHIQTLLRKGYIELLMNHTTTTQIQITHDGSLYQRALAALLAADMDVSLLDAAWFAEKPSLFICGAGHVAKELAAIASFLDFRITVMDSRSEFANHERYPHAQEIICAPFEELSAHLEKDNNHNSYYVVVTPGHQDDYTCVKQLLVSSYTYLGMIGSRKKIAATYDRLRADGFTDEQINTIHAPIGLSIGAATPAEIAISILAEIIEIKNKESSASISSELLHTTESGTLCIIIGKTGSAPRGIGSMMLVTKHRQIDSLGGGAVEAQVIKDAANITTPCIREYNLGPSDAAGLGMICGGTNKVLFIPQG